MRSGCILNQRVPAFLVYYLTNEHVMREVKSGDVDFHAKIYKTKLSLTFRA